MNDYKKIIKFQNSIFFSMKVPSTIFMITYILTLAVFLYFTYLEMPFYSMCHTVVRFIYYVCIIFAFITYYYLIQSQKNNVDEVVELTRKSHFKNTVIYMVSFVLSWNVLLILILLLNASFTMDKLFSIQFVFKSFVFNCMIPEMIMMIVAIMSAKMEKENLGFAIFALFMFLSGPFFESMNWPVKPDKPTDIIIENITKLFHIFYQNGEMSPDVLYGLQIESRRIFIFIFWMILFAGIYFVKKYKKTIIMVISVGAMLLVSIPVYKDRSLYRMSMDYKSAGYSDLYTYGFFDHTLQPYMPPQEADFEVTHYQMDIDIDEKLYVEASIDIESSKPIQQCEFTLYRGYQVKSIQSDFVNDFQQKDDQIIINFKDAITKCSLDIQYAGYHPKYYSNECAAMLPGYFPWYPMPGEKQIFVDGYGMNPYNRVDKCQFDVTISSHYPLVTNLKETNNQYSGKADSLTIIGGNIDTVSNSNIQNILPLEYIEAKTKEEYVKHLEENFIQKEKLLKDIYKIDLDLKNKKVIIAPKDLGRNYKNNQIILFDDYILCSIECLYTDSYQEILEYYITTPQYQGIMKEEMIWAVGENMDEVKEVLLRSVKREIDFKEEMLNKWSPDDEGYSELEEEKKIYEQFYPYLSDDENILNIIYWMHEGFNDQEILIKLESGE